MTCYFRYRKMKEIFDEIGVNVTEENKRDIDRKIHSLVGVDYKNCSATWKEIKRRVAEDEAVFISKLKETII